MTDSDTRGRDDPGTPAAGTHPAEECGMEHPLLAGVWCQRLPGHPGRHAAVADTDAAELTLEWNDDAE